MEKSTQECSWCHGSGRFTVSYEGYHKNETCPKCLGKGVAVDLCPACGGSGWVIDPAAMPHREPCPVCQGGER